MARQLPEVPVLQAETEVSLEQEGHHPHHELPGDHSGHEHRRGGTAARPASRPATAHPREHEGRALTGVIHRGEQGQR